MRTVFWARVSEPSEEPPSWSEIEVDDTADKAEVRQQVLLDSSFPSPPELRLKSEKGGWRKWGTCQSLPLGDLYVKIVCQKPGQFDMLMFRKISPCFINPKDITRVPDDISLVVLAACILLTRLCTHGKTF